MVAFNLIQPDLKMHKAWKAFCPGRRRRRRQANKLNSHFHFNQNIGAGARS